MNSHKLGYSVMKNKLLLHVMRVHLYRLCFVKVGFNASAKSIEPGQLAQSLKADLDRNILLLVSCVDVIRLY